MVVRGGPTHPWRNIERRVDQRSVRVHKGAVRGDERRILGSYYQFQKSSQRSGTDGDVGRESRHVREPGRRVGRLYKRQKVYFWEEGNKGLVGSGENPERVGVRSPRKT